MHCVVHPLLTHKAAFGTGRNVTLKLPDKCRVNKVSVTMFRSNPAGFAGNQIWGHADQMKKVPKTFR